MAFGASRNGAARAVGLAQLNLINMDESSVGAAPAGDASRYETAHDDIAIVPTCDLAVAGGLTERHSAAPRSTQRTTANPTVCARSTAEDGGTRQSNQYPHRMTFDRIAADTAVMAGVPCIRGTRIPVATIVGMVAEGMTITEILADFPQLSEQDVRQALWFAAAAVDQATLPLPA
ncbi:MAG TPA: DUF433 domain-containing protein [Pseudonocardia sp.]|jgi:uncharacterized protein (DUF433 family)|nr:DUF433 domain-containing protein [Pseudonocardia sp.]